MADPFVQTRIRVPAPASLPRTRGSFELRRFAALTPRIITIGASTGGPQALTLLLQQLAPAIADVPVVIVQHMPGDFTGLVADQVQRLSGLPTRAAINGEEPKPGHIYLAPGDQHLRIIKLGKIHLLSLSNGPPENFCRPAVDVLFRSAAQAYGPGTLGVVLTGMGSDGLLGSRAIVDAGGSVIAQDEPTSVVWGMPGAVAQAGLAAAVLPLGAIAGAIANRMAGTTPASVAARLAR